MAKSNIGKGTLVLKQLVIFWHNGHRIVYTKKTNILYAHDALPCHRQGNRTRENLPQYPGPARPSFAFSRSLPRRKPDL